jgi:hypothetical protein
LPKNTVQKKKKEEEAAPVLHPVGISRKRYCFPIGPVHTLVRFSRSDLRQGSISMPVTVP